MEEDMSIDTADFINDEAALKHSLARNIVAHLGLRYLRSKWSRKKFLKKFSYDSVLVQNAYMLETHNWNAYESASRVLYGIDL